MWIGYGFNGCASVLPTFFVLGIGEIENSDGPGRQDSWQKLDQRLRTGGCDNEVWLFRAISNSRLRLEFFDGIRLGKSLP